MSSARRIDRRKDVADERRTSKGVEGWPFARMTVCTVFLPPMCVARLILVHLGHVSHEIHDAVAVTPFIVIPRHELDEGVVECDTGICIED